MLSILAFFFYSQTIKTVSFIFDIHTCIHFLVRYENWTLTLYFMTPTWRDIELLFVWKFQLASRPSVRPSIHRLGLRSECRTFQTQDLSDLKEKDDSDSKPFLTIDLSDTGAFRIQTFSDPTIVFFMNLLGYRVCIHVCLSLCLFVCLCLFFICGWVSWTLSVDNLEQ